MEDLFTIEVVTSFAPFKAKARYQVGPEFLRRYGKYVKVVSEPEGMPAEELAEEPKAPARKKKAAANGSGGDLQEEG